jgi:tRNA 2-selenouridine synthase SelU
MKALLATVAVCFALTGCASSTDLQRVTVQTKSMEEQVTAQDMRLQRLEQSREARVQQDVAQYCFLGTQMFSEGAYYAGKTCTRKAGMMVYQGGKPVVYPLVWQ